MSDLVIGSRRTSSRLRAAIAVLGLSGALLLVTVLIYGRLVSYPDPDVKVDDQALSFEDGRLVAAGGSLEFAGKVSIVSLRGSPAQIGFAHGRLIGEAAAPRLASLTAALIETVPEGGILSPFRNARLRWRLRLLDDGIPGHQLVEMRALARGAGLDDEYESLVRAHAALDIGLPPSHTLGHEARQMNRSLAVMASVRNDKGDRLMIARAVSSPGLATPPTTPTLFVVHADDAIPFASIGKPGATGVLTGVNAEGIAVFVNPGRTLDVGTARRGQPAPLIAREVLEQARTLSDAIKIVEKADILGAAVFLLVDGKKRAHTTVERGPGKRSRDERRTVVDEIFVGKPFKDDPVNDRAGRSSAAEARRDRARTMLRAVRSAGAEGLVSLLRDRRGESNAPLPAGHRATLDDPAADHVAVIDPSAMVMWICEGPGSSGTFRAIDLRHRLSNSSQAATAPADIPGSDADDDTRRVQAAHLDLQAALELSARGKRRRASERAERAVSWAPQLPLARLIAGRLADRAGRRQAAERHYRAFLANPDSPAAREQVQAALGSF